MTNKLPNLNNKSKICIICEGDEEYEYLDKLKLLYLWSDEYNIELVNAKGNGNIPARYQDKFQNGSYNIVLVFCDTDKKPYEQYEDIKRKINEFHGLTDAADDVVIFGNPCTMQIIILHWCDIILKSHKKKDNAPIIQECVGIENYKAREDQRNQLFAQITLDNYKKMCKRVKKLSTDDTVVGSSNFGKFIDYFSSENEKWIEEINYKMEL